MQVKNILTSDTVFVKNECFITPFLLTHTLNDLFPDTPYTIHNHHDSLKKKNGGG